MDKDAIKGILQRYIPPLSFDMVEEMSEAIFSEMKKESQSQSVAASSKGRTLRKRK